MSRSYALLIGINEYPMIDPKYRLDACVGDVQLVKTVLTQRFDFAEEDIVELHDAAATQKAILASMQDLVEKAGAEDRVYFHFAGHGSTIPSAEENTTQGTGLDSTIMTHDSGRDKAHPNLDIRDGEIGEWLDALTAKTQNITLVFDCCHSGTITRDPFAATGRSGPAETRSLAELDLPLRPRKSKTRGASNAFVPRSDHYVVISGCRDDEESNEYLLEHEGVSMLHGALTYWLCQSLLASKPGTTYQDVFEGLSLRVNSMFPHQHPQIEGRRNRVLLGTDTVSPLKYFSLTHLTDQGVTLAGGAAHGIEEGSKWAVYPAATNRIADSEPLAHLRVDKLEALTASAKVLDQSGDLAPGARCVQISTPHQIQSLAVDLLSLEQNLQTRIAERIADSTLLNVASTSEIADLKVRAQGALFEIVAKDGTAVAPAHELAQAIDLSRLRENLETLAKARNVQALHNTDSNLQASFVLHCRPKGGNWAQAEDNAEFRSGDSVAFEFTNREQRPLFVALMDIGLTGRVTPFYPPNKASGELVAAGATIKVGFEGNLTLRIPSGYHATSGRETFKAIITTAETDFSFMTQEGTRSVNQLNALQELLSRAGGNKTRDLSDSSAGTETEDWISINRSCELHAS
jgi:hypothetical protein